MKKGQRIVGDDRNAMAAQLKLKYENGASIRALAESIQRSYGFVQRLLVESGARLRPRGGGHRRTLSRRVRTDAEPAAD
ncbi:helix-turn-helix domain-containing protein [Amycolatopsis sp. VC5-11]|uniref:helix-turn-helix domain-containing protein n=1 Tax=Amycolatopsis sp. VC5-11 TaxID=3120156 RepID=UPI003FA5E31D